MVSIWKSKNDDNPEEEASGNDHGDEGHDSHKPTIDERTRLLYAQSQQGYLSPDDPAVTPYNLWSVWFLRLFSLIFLSLTLVWWILLFTSIFVSPPGIYTRGSGFFGFSYATLTLAILLIVLLFFSTPSKAEQFACLTLAVILLFNAIMILAVPKIREEEGWVGITSVAWAFMISVWTVLTDRIVGWGKQEEEERLTGRSETRRTLLEWLAVFSSTIVLITITGLAFLISCTLVIRARDSSLDAPGNRYYVDGNKYQIHLFCSPKDPINSNETQTPTVLFEAGQGAFDGSMVQIAENALENGTIGRYCYSDRPGIAWSDNAPSPFSAGIAGDVLSEALALAGERGPWILVSAGVGSIYSRVFSSRYGSTVKGLLMIDPLHEDYLQRLGSPSRGFLLWVRGILSPLGLDQIPAAIFRGRTREDRIFGRSAQYGGKYIKAKLQESLVAGSLTRNEILSANNIQDENVPLVLISSGVEVKKDGEWEAKQRDLSHLTKKLLSWDIVDRAPSEVWKNLEGRKIIEKRLQELIEASSDV